MLKPGQILNQYEISDYLGRGNLGAVYRAFHRALEREAAIKVIDAQHAEDERFIDRFRQEARICARFANPHIVSIFDFDDVELDGRRVHYLAMELVEGRTLQQILESGGPLPVDTVLKIGLDLVSALDTIHSQHILHRDLKPGNVMFDETRGAKLMDFGLARGGTPAANGSFVGSLAYAAPEAVSGSEQTSAADIYSLGVTLHELLTGGLPFDGVTAHEYHQNQKSQPPKSARAGRPAVSAELASLIEGMLTADPLGRISDLKSIRATLQNELDARADVPAATDWNQPPLVGRQAELEGLGGTFKAALDGSGSAALITGEAGTGKSRLVQGMIDEAEGSKRFFLTMQAHCQESRSGVPYDPVIELVRSFIGEDDVEDRLRGYLPDLEPIIPELSRFLTRQIEQEGKPRFVSEATLMHILTHLMQNISREIPLLVIIEDVHWADRSTLELLNYLKRNLSRSRILLVMTCREEDLSAEESGSSLTKLNDPEQMQIFKLDRLSQADARRLVESLVQDHSLADRLLSTLMKETAGNPFFLIETLKLLRQEGMLEKGAEIDIAGMEMPRSVEEVVEKKLDKLGPEETRLLGAASLQGEEFTPALLAACLQLEAVDIEQRLALLHSDTGLIRLTEEGGRFDNNLIFRRCLNLLDEQDAKTLRRSLAQHMSEKFVAGDKAVIYDLALQLKNLPDEPDAVRYLALAAELALGEFAYREALVHTESARSSPRFREDMDLAFKVLKLQFDALSGIGHLENRSECAHSALQLARESGEPRKIGEALLMNGQHMFDRAQLVEAQDACQEALDVYRRIPDRYGESEAALILASIHLELAEPDKNQEFLNLALEIKEELEDWHGVGNIYKNLGTLNHHKLSPKTLDYYKLSLEMAQKTGDKFLEGTLRTNMGHFYKSVGNFDEALACYEQSNKTLTAIGFRRIEGVYYHSVAQILSIRGEFQKALEYMERALTVRREIGDLRGEGETLNNLGNFYGRFGDYEKALEYHLKVKEIREKNREERLLISTYHNIGELYSLMGRYNESGEMLMKGIELSEKFNWQEAEMNLHASLGMLLTQKDYDGYDPGRAFEHGRRTLDLGLEMSLSGKMVDGHTVIAASYLRQNKPLTALEHCRRAVELLREGGRGSSMEEQTLFISYQTLMELKRYQEAKHQLEELKSLVLDKSRKYKEPRYREKYLSTFQHVFEEEARATSLAAKEAAEKTDISKSVSFVESNPAMVEDKLRILGMLSQISAKVSSSLNLQDVLDSIIDQALELTSAERGFIILQDDEGMFDFRSSRGISIEEIRGREFTISRSVVDEVIRENRPIMTNNTSLDSSFRNRGSVLEFDILSLICVPLALREEVIGAIYLDNRAIAANFDSDHLEFLMIFANTAAIAISNANQYEEVLRSSISREKITFGEVVARSEAMRDVIELAKRASLAGTSTVLITGQSGTGKELIARAIHFEGVRADKPFVTVNCAAIPDSLLESELFGHVKGAFTDARTDKKGLVERADGGTLFLDEIGDMPLNLQAKLLRFLQDRTFTPLGGETEKHVEMRVLAATNQDLKLLIEQKQFREDLYFRLNVIPIEMPPLTARIEDISLLAGFYIDCYNAELDKDVKGISPAAVRILEAHDWPGNVRELKNLVERVMIFITEDVVLPRHLPPEFRGAEAAAVDDSSEPLDEDRILPLSEVEKNYLAKVLDSVGGNRSKAAKLLGVSRNTIIRKVSEYGLDQ